MRPIRKKVWSTKEDLQRELEQGELQNEAPKEANALLPRVPKSASANECVPEGTLWTLHLRREHIVMLVAFGLCLVLWTRLCSVSAKLALLESSSHLYKK